MSKKVTTGKVTIGADPKLYNLRGRDTLATDQKRFMSPHSIKMSPEVASISH